MAEDPPKCEKTARLPASPTIPFPSKNEQRAAAIPQDTPDFRPVHPPIVSIKRSDYCVPQPQKEGVVGIIVAVIAVLAIFIALGAAYWWMRR